MENKKSDVYPLRIIKKKINKNYVKVKDKKLDLEIKNINIYNCLASLAVIKRI